MPVLGLFPQLTPGGLVVLCIFLGSVACGSHLLWRLPLLAVFGALLLCDLSVYLSLRVLVRVCEMLATARLFTRRSLHSKMKRAKSYAEWAKYARQLDEFERREEWKESEADNNYHPRVVHAAVEKLREARARGDVITLVDVVRPCLVKNFGGVMNYEMYAKTHCGTKRLIEEFVTELEASLQDLTRLAQEERLDKGRETLRELVQSSSQSFGKASLLLSGGAGLGFYHFGVLRALLAEDLLPNVLCGTSMGAIVLSFVATRTNAEALEELRKLEDLHDQVGPNGPMQGSILWKVRQILRRGYTYELKDVAQHLQWFTQGMTFQEAYQKTGRSVNITCTPRKTTAVKGLPPLLLNHLTTPRVTITSAVLASSCVPCLIPVVQLMEKRADGTLGPYQGIQGSSSGESLDMVCMRDGSFESDVPVQAMSSFFNCHFNMVSQVNPHIIPFFYNAQGAIGRPIRWPWRNYRGGFLSSLLECWCKEDMIKILRVLKMTGMLYNVFGVDWSYLFLQEAQGDITIVPNATPSDYLRIVDNAGSRADFEDQIRKSERSTWRHFSIIRNRMRIDRALEALERSVQGPSRTRSWAAS